MDAVQLTFTFVVLEIVLNHSGAHSTRYILIKINDIEQMRGNVDYISIVIPLKL